MGTTPISFVRSAASEEDREKRSVTAAVINAYQKSMALHGRKEWTADDVRGLGIMLGATDAAASSDPAPQDYARSAGLAAVAQAVEHPG